MKIKKSSIWIFLLQLIFFLILEIAYRYFIVPHYDDFGFTYDYNFERYAYGKILFLFVLAIILFLSASDFLFAILNILFSFFFIPNLILFQFMSAPIVIVLGIGFIPIFSIVLSRTLPSIKSRTITTKQRLPVLFYVSLVLLIPFLIAFGFSISSAVFSFENVYTIRAQSEHLNNVFTNYTYSLLSTWVLPLCLIYGYWKKKWLLMVFSVLALLYLYSITGNKVTFFAIFVALGFLPINTYRGKVIGMLLGLNILFVIGLIYSENIPDIGDLLIRRFLFLPALLNVQYLEFFHHAPVYYSHSFLSSFILYPYELPPPRMIGITYYHGGNMTNGIISDGYLNLGVIGIFINALLVSLIIVFFTKLKIHAIFLGLFFLLIQKFIDSGLSTALLTHGVFLFAILSLFVIKNTDQSIVQNE